jgi:hypothetical protein
VLVDVFLISAISAAILSKLDCIDIMAKNTHKPKKYRKYRIVTAYQLKG